jgi:hypothetical protein
MRQLRIRRLTALYTDFAAIGPLYAPKPVATSC